MDHIRQMVITKNNNTTLIKSHKNNSVHTVQQISSKIPTRILRQLRKETVITKNHSEKTNTKTQAQIIIILENQINQMKTMIQIIIIIDAISQRSPPYLLT